MGKKKGRKEGTVSTAEYTEGTWKGLPNFQCNKILPSGEKCPFSTLREELMQAHRAKDHNPSGKRFKGN